MTDVWGSLARGASVHLISENNLGQDTVAVLRIDALELEAACLVKSAGARVLGIDFEQQVFPAVEPALRLGVREREPRETAPGEFLGDEDAIHRIGKAFVETAQHVEAGGLEAATLLDLQREPLILHGVEGELSDRVRLERR